MVTTKYNYIFFNTPDSNKYRANPDGYYTICLADLEKVDYAINVSYPLDHAPLWIRKLFAIHNSAKIDKYIHLPLKRVWYKYYFRDTFADKKPLCLVILNHNLPIEYLKYVKKRYPDAKIVLLHRDLVKVCARSNPQYLDSHIFDLRMSFDKNESAIYGLPHFDEFESRIDVPIAPDYPLSDVFFAGKAKDRLPKLMPIYHRLTQDGLKCHFYLTGVPKEMQEDLPGIEYADSFMSYRRMLFLTVNSRCVLEINQDNADGYTSRFLEAVMFNKRLITNNFAVKASPFYNPAFIQCINDADELDTSFISDTQNVNHHYNGEFSPLRLIQQIDSILAEQDAVKR